MKTKIFAGTAFFCLAFISVAAFFALTDKTFFKNGDSLKKNRILVMITSYKRPMLLSGQILRFMNQTYDNFKISVSIKGTQQKWIDATFMKEWQPFIDSGKLMIRFDENREQLSNLLDTIRNVSLDDYDYFCKVDDDDWYAPNYLSDVNLWLNKEKNIDISSTTNMVFLEEGRNRVKMYYQEKSRLSGQTICISKKIANALFNIEKNPAAYEPMYLAKTVNANKARNEDTLMLNLSHAIGARMQERDTPKSDIIYGRQYPSISRSYY